MDNPLSQHEVDQPGLAELFREGWKAFSEDDFLAAKGAFEKAARLDTGNPDYLYCLGLTEKSMGESEKSIQSFNRVIDLTYILDDKTRATIIRRLAHAHINHITKGDWDLEKDLWKKTG